MEKQIIVFTLGEKHYAVNSDQVEEISKMMDSTVVPNAPKHIRGLINLRGNVVALVNLSELLRLKEKECYNNIVIMNKEDEKIGILVTEVKEVLKIQDEDIEKVSGDGKNGVVGIIQLGGNLVNYIDLERIIS
ncbi:MULTISPECIES: chemotaxis protein CheW [Proteiniclasticum]|jgi:purine-binding chemotaxis protein CheW|uniref:Purine-binding chemotaxis protein CheW n=1 Tax=Proteiniclasticum ruminis TaxID=398199 RepID=A0A1G8I1Z0_9CLOT|nr:MULTISPECIES: chemotaxis protein CheW [Proteiniclasticum]SDI12864.1 purine-binding chemotaxis protein CheW [Proteiniclasticum ruminis]HBW13675.1 chemotaxis protein CheW [Proteiniclasticum sp.]